MEAASAATAASNATGSPGHGWLRTTNLALATVGIAVCTPLLVMRVYTKIRIMKKFWWDDVCLICAWVISMATQGTIIYGFEHAHIGVHIWFLTPDQINTYLKVVVSAATIYISSLALAKIALLMLYHRLLSMIRFWKYVINGVAIFIIAYSIALTLALIFACHPVGRNWDVTDTTGGCISRPGIYMATAVTNTLSDVVLILIPVPIVMKLTLPTVQKVGIFGMFLVGCLTIVTSIVRLATLWPLVTSVDPTYKLALASVFIVIEANFIIICGCLPYFRQFLRFHCPWLIGIHSSTAESHSRGSSTGETPPCKARKPGLSQLQDDIGMALTEPPIPMENGRGYFSAV
ncbi:hypothetical protein BO86DRAFT_389552 [Aspergillus japonicus CBS 114.51]|uniref:Rhodopsin domain-containing protein n=2 Tax=Aspergillus TaxID=5052 RepID=A0A2V5GYK8_ASPV1|nr:hypothetical protein BO86DRAFT_389552 [Aspergillus japonicus CBS 114.51]PYI14314.1 hypothetical protein BO99DRAFT_406808 [Aspergillus violaceofuscus CBS 115571]RAH81315.1 hypothetical protein BO86DRAFT_389552 [Aspergillus japonicus CBS 114.51]